MSDSYIPKLVSADMYINDVVMRYPSAAEVMLSYGLHCVGCHISQFETIRQGAAGHGQMDDEDINVLLEEMNEVVAQEELAVISETLSITHNAANQLVEYASSQHPDELVHVRVSAVKQGCELEYDLDFTKEKQDDDVVVSTGEIEVLLDKSSAQAVQGGVLDFIEDIDASGFKIQVPNDSSCACKN